MDLNRVACELLEIPETDDALSLLGIASGRFDLPAIHAGLRRRIAQLAVHPKSCEDETQQIREYLHGVATQLCASAPQQHPKEKRFLKLTDLDKNIIATLVAQGGWNQKSRARLVAVAMSYGISVGGLTRILEAIAEAARQGDGPLCIEKRKKLKITREWSSSLPPPPSHFDTLITSASGKLNLDFSTCNNVLTVKLCAFFALLVLFVMFFGVALLFSVDDEPVTQIETKNTTSSFLDQTEDIQVEVFKPMFSTVPTFSFPELELQCMNYSDEAISVPQRLSELAESIQDTLMRGEDPKEQWIVQWEDAIKKVSHGWPFVSNETLTLINHQIINVIRRSELLPEYTERLMQFLTPPDIRLGEPFLVLKKSWCVGMLASIKCSTILSPNTRSFAASQQNETTRQIKTCDSFDARAECLDLIMEELHSTTTFDTRTMEQWEAWMIAASSFTNQKFAHERYLLAIERILFSNLDLLRESNTRKVLGRITLQNKSIRTNQFRERVLAMYKDDKVTSIDLAVFGNMIFSSDNSPWFSSKFIVKLNTTDETRAAITESLAKEWPIEKTIDTHSSNFAFSGTIDVKQIHTWQSIYSALNRDDGLSRYIISLRFLNEAAANISLGRTDQVERILQKIERFKLDTPKTLPKVFLQQTGDDWSVAFTESASSALDTLAQDGVTELGVIDAHTLAKAALLKHSNSVREQATDIIISQFYNNENVAIAMLDYLDNYYSKREVSKLVANLTEVVLPEQSSSRWKEDARRAMVQHAISTTQPEQKELDYLSIELSESLVDEFLVMNPTAILPSGEISSLKAIEMLVHYRGQPLSQAPSDMVFVFNPSGLLQSFLHKQIEYYVQLRNADSGLGYSQKDDFVRSLRTIAANDSTIIEQIASIEFLVASHWDLFLSTIAVEIQTMESTQ